VRRGSIWLVLLGVLLATCGGALARQKPVCACECVPITPAEAQNEADVVFVGTARHVVGTVDPDSPDPVTYVFALQKMIKGPRHPGRTVRVQTSASSAACGIDFKIGARYAVYAVNSDGVLFAMICGGSRRLTPGDPGPTPTPALSATPSTRQAETLPPRLAAALLPAVGPEPASASEATEEDPQMPVEGVIAAVGIICILLVAIVLVSRHRD
jgi:hypothetical protein